MSERRTLHVPVSCLHVHRSKAFQGRTPRGDGHDSCLRHIKERHGRLMKRIMTASK